MTTPEPFNPLGRVNRFLPGGIRGWTADSVGKKKAPRPALFVNGQFRRFIDGRFPVEKPDGAMGFSLSIANELSEHDIFELRYEGSAVTIPGAGPISPQQVLESKLIEQKAQYEAWVSDYMTDQFMHSPRLLSVETFVHCNATCEFCPYPTSTRIGERLDDALIYKIIDDIAPAATHPELFVPARINEPLFDKRLFDICGYLYRAMPKTKVVHFSNGTTLNKRNVHKLSETPNFQAMRLSLNSHVADTHREIMGIDFQLVQKNMRYIHDAMSAGDLSWVMHVNRVGDGTVADDQFLSWGKENFPLFQFEVSTRFDWIGKISAPEIGAIPDICSQWFQLCFLANGRDSLCCIDDDGRFGEGDIRTMSALEIYNHPARLRLRQQKSRGAHPACAGCTALV